MDKCLELKFWAGTSSCVAEIPISPSMQGRNAISHQVWERVYSWQLPAEWAGWHRDQRGHGCCCHVCEGCWCWCRWHGSWHGSQLGRRCCSWWGHCWSWRRRCGRSLVLLPRHAQTLHGSRVRGFIGRLAGAVPFEEGLDVLRMLAAQHCVWQALNALSVPVASKAVKVKGTAMPLLVHAAPHHCCKQFQLLLNQLPGNKWLELPACCILLQHLLSIWHMALLANLPVVRIVTGSLCCNCC